MLALNLESIIICNSFPLIFEPLTNFLFISIFPFLIISHQIGLEHEKNMEIFQDSTFTAFVAIILCFLVGKIVSFAVSDSADDHNSSVCAAVAKEVSLNRRLRVKTTKGIKKVKFVDDVKVESVDRFASEDGSESLVLLDDAESKNEGENSVKRVDETGEMGIKFDSEVKGSEKQCFDVKEMNDVDAQNKECEITEMLVEKDCGGDKKDMVLGVINEMLVEKDRRVDNIDISLGEEGLIIQEPKNEIVLECDDMKNDQKQENGAVGFGENEGLSGGDEADVVKPRGDGVLVVDDDDDDDWEGIERSELEKVFAEAVNFVEYGGKGKEKDVDWWAKLDGDKKTLLYGLHKVAVEGPCREPQPMALLVSSRAKWNAWQKLGNMSPEEAMEKYIRILSESVPHWMPGYSADTDLQGSFKFETDTDSEPVLNPILECGRKLELNATDICDSNISPSCVEHVTADSAKD
ncbi:acyl-CoA-binding domain-containing protein 3-like isoform X2 [Henckelia pumila]|uniref:acyl-CoA-binding domain-containing protein 3-like isoform X2 n=1 Tax=Henckelia pumila TaxID=405737 RepID=UPI003C6E569F